MIGGGPRGPGLGALQSRCWSLEDGVRPLRGRITSAGDELTREYSEWEVELGFGKGRYLLDRAAAEPGVGFLGVEMVSRYFRLAAQRAQRRTLANLKLLHGEASYLLATMLPFGFARALHVYFPDPWRKSRHHKRRLMDIDSIDLLLGCLTPGGQLFFASDHAAYSEAVVELVCEHPLLAVTSLDGGWPEGPRTNYEAKFVEEGRAITRLVCELTTATPGADRSRLLHPAAREGLVCSWQKPEDDPEEGQPEAGPSGRPRRL